jgi:hypothetical protein
MMRQYGTSWNNLSDFYKKSNKFQDSKRLPAYVGGRFEQIAVFFLSIRLFVWNFAEVKFKYFCYEGLFQDFNCSGYGFRNYGGMSGSGEGVAE